jgi:hypothetical protein
MTMDQPESPELPVPADGRTEQRMTRSQVAERLGVSVSKVRTMEGKSLHPTKVDGVYRFDPKEIEAAAKTQGRRSGAKLTEGEVAAAVFKAINNGQELRDIVIELEQPPSVVRALYREWFDDFGAGEDRLQKAERAEREERERRAGERRDDADARAFERSMGKILKQGR